VRVRLCAFVLAASATVSACKRTSAHRAHDAEADREVPPPVVAFSAEAYRERARVPAIAFAAVTSRAVVVSGATGQADVGRAADAAETTPFEAASIAKTVVATCVMQLVEEKKLDLDVDVSRWVGFPVRHPTSARPITLRLLLQHRASIRDVDGEIGAPGGVAIGELVRRVLVTDGGGPRAVSFLDAGPGDEARYSNLGATLAAYAVERASGESFADRAAHRVFEPLGMRDTSWSARAGAAVPYAEKDAGFVALPQASHAVYPSVDLRSTARDLARYARAILRGGELDGTRVLGAASVSTMTRESLGWQSRTVGRRAVVGHEGEDAGASTALFLDLAAGAGAVVLANGDAFTSGDAARAAALEDLLADLLAEAVASAK
jgi:CubicO group peptidase (beta-lactamase class C family)